MTMRERFAEGLADRREEIMKRTDVGREELARRAQAIREQFAENVTEQAVTSFAGWTLVSSGVAWGVTDWIRGRHDVRSLLLPIALLTLGFAVLGGGTVWHRRSLHIDEAEARLREGLEELGPFARMRVLRDLAGNTVPFVRHITAHN